MNEINGFAVSLLSVGKMNGFERQRVWRRGEVQRGSNRVRFNVVATGRGSTWWQQGEDREVQRGGKTKRARLSLDKIYGAQSVSLCAGAVSLSFCGAAAAARSHPAAGRAVALSACVLNGNVIETTKPMNMDIPWDIGRPSLYRCPFGRSRCSHSSEDSASIGQRIYHLNYNPQECPSAELLIPQYLWRGGIVL